MCLCTHDWWQIQFTDAYPCRVLWLSVQTDSAEQLVMSKGTRQNSNGQQYRRYLSVQFVQTESCYTQIGTPVPKSKHSSLTLYDVFILSYLLFICKVSICQSLFSSFSSGFRHETPRRDRRLSCFAFDRTTKNSKSCSGSYFYIFSFRIYKYPLGGHENISTLWLSIDVAFGQEMTMVAVIFDQKCGSRHGRVIRIPTALESLWCLFVAWIARLTCLLDFSSSVSCWQYFFRFLAFLIAPRSNHFKMSDRYSNWQVVFSPLRLWWMAAESTSFLSAAIRAI